MNLQRFCMLGVVHGDAFELPRGFGHAEVALFNADDDMEDDLPERVETLLRGDVVEFMVDDGQPHDGDLHVFSRRSMREWWSTDYRP